MIISQGDVQKADYMLDTSWYEYHYRVIQHRKYVDWHNERVKEQMKK